MLVKHSLQLLYNFAIICFKLFSELCKSKTIFNMSNQCPGENCPLTSRIHCTAACTPFFAIQIYTSFLGNPWGEIDHIVPSTITESQSSTAFIVAKYSSS